MSKVVSTNKQIAMVLDATGFAPQLVWLPNRISEIYPSRTVPGSPWVPRRLDRRHTQSEGRCETQSRDGPLVSHTHQVMQADVPPGSNVATGLTSPRRACKERDEGPLDCSFNSWASCPRYVDYAAHR